MMLPVRVVGAFRFVIMPVGFIVVDRRVDRNWVGGGMQLFIRRAVVIGPSHRVGRFHCLY
jgi:hypothetical protein